MYEKKKRSPRRVVWWFARAFIFAALLMAAVAFGANLENMSRLFSSVISSLVTATPAPSSTATDIPTVTAHPPTSMQVLKSSTPITTQTKTPAPTATHIPPSRTPFPPTETIVPPTSTPIPPSATPIPPTKTTLPPTVTPVPPSATSIPPTLTAFPIRRISPPVARQTRGAVNLRSGPGTSFDLVGSVAANTVLRVIGEIEDWYLISHNGLEVFIAGWLTYDLPTVTPTLRRASTGSTSSTRIAVRRFASPLRKFTHGTVNLRSGPGTSYGQVGAVAAGATLQVLGQSGDWHLVRHNGKDAFIASWLTHNSPPASPSRQQEQSVSSAQNNSQSSSQSTYSCNCKKTCGAMSSCAEAYYQLNNCGCRRRDGDNDGVPCESICGG